MSPLGVVDLDLSITPDVICLRAFDVAKPLTRMLPGQFLNELGLMIPDLGVDPEGFHDIVIEDLSDTPAWQSRRLLPGDVTSFRRLWSKILLRTMRKHLVEMEQLRRDCCDQPGWEFRHSHPGRCSLCQEYVATALDRHMMNVHLELGQLWRCPVEWCTVWKGSLCDCLGHLHEKHGGSQYVDMNNLEKCFPRRLCSETFGWRPFVRMCLVWRWTPRLFHDFGCRLVHKCQVYHDLFPQTALRGRVMNKLLALVARVMVIAHLTQLHKSITILASESVAEAVPEECFPPVPLPRALVLSRRVSFASVVTILGTAPESSADREPTSICPPALLDPVPVDLPDIQIHEPVYTLFPEEDPMDASTVVSKPDFLSLPARRVSIASSGPGALFSPNDCLRLGTVFGLHSAVWKVCCYVASSPVFRVDWHVRVFWRWPRGCGSILCRGNRLLMRPANFTGTFP